MREQWCDAQRQEWEDRYAESERRFQLHTAQIERHRAAAAASAAEEGSTPSNYSSDDAAATPAAPAADAEAEVSGSLASDEQLAALREKLAGN